MCIAYSESWCACMWRIVLVASLDKQHLPVYCGPCACSELCMAAKQPSVLRSLLPVVFRCAMSTEQIKHMLYISAVSADGGEQDEGGRKTTQGNPDQSGFP